MKQAGIDAAEQKALEELQRILLQELHHRVKNTLATVMAIASQSLRNAVDLPHGRRAIENRLLALGRAQDMLLQTNWTSARLATILKSAIEPFDAEGARFVVQSSDIEVSSAAVLPLAMVLNELCTNAVKYVALSNSVGRVKISSVIETDGRFRLTWIEGGGPTVRPPTRRGFGTQLIERSFVSQLNGEAHLRYEPAGLVCVLDIPFDLLKPQKPT